MHDGTRVSIREMAGQTESAGALGIFSRGRWQGSALGSVSSPCFARLDDGDTFRHLPTRGSVRHLCGPRDQYENWQASPRPLPPTVSLPSAMCSMAAGPWPLLPLLGIAEAQSYGPIVNVDKTPAPYGNTRRLITDADVGGDAKRAHSSVEPGKSRRRMRRANFSMKTSGDISSPTRSNEIGQPVPPDPACLKDLRARRRSLQNKLCGERLCPYLLALASLSLPRRDLPPTRSPHRHRKIVTRSFVPPKEINFREPRREYVEHNRWLQSCGASWRTTIRTSPRPRWNEWKTSWMKCSICSGAGARSPASGALFPPAGQGIQAGGRDNAGVFSAQFPQFNPLIDPHWGGSMVFIRRAITCGLTDDWALRLLLHECGHAWHLEQWPEKQKDILSAYENAMAHKLYEGIQDVAGNRGGKGVRGDQSTRVFCRDTCAISGAAIEPFDREATAQARPQGFAMIEKCGESTRLRRHRNRRRSSLQILELIGRRVRLSTRFPATSWSPQEFVGPCVLISKRISFCFSGHCSRCHAMPTFVQESAQRPVVGQPT